VATIPAHTESRLKGHSAVRIQWIIPPYTSENADHLHGDPVERRTALPPKLSKEEKQERTEMGPA